MKHSLSIPMIKIKTPITVVIVSIFLSYSCENASNNRMSNASRKDVNELMDIVISSLRDSAEYLISTISERLKLRSVCRQLPDG